MTQKKVIINNCLECPYLEREHYCGIDSDPDRYITNNSNFPEWCSLEDA
jgi:hypothetical protein